MPQLTWYDELSVGDEQIDNQHKKLISIANTLLDAMKEKKAKDVIFEVIRELREYTVHHFHDEEEYMKSLNYPGLGEHEQEHQKLKEEVKKYQRYFYKRDDVPVQEVKGLLEKWLLKHILEVDKKYVEYVKEQKRAEEEAGEKEEPGDQKGKEKEKPAGLQESP